MPLVLSLRSPTRIPLEVESVQPEIVCRQSVDQVRQTLIYYGNQRPPLGEFFDAHGSAHEDRTLIWEGDCSRVKGIGSGMATGKMLVRGDAGMHLGAEMTGGEIRVEGNAGDWLGAEMRGGKIEVTGNAGHCTGAVYRGGRCGMRGEILVQGSVGDELGRCLRRGLIAVGGSTGAAPGCQMLAGSLFLFGSVGIRPGLGMRRGTIAVLGPSDPPVLPPTFRYACTDSPVFLRFYLRHLATAGFPVGGLHAPSVRRFTGDLLELGKGEILIRE